jgi:hypothetical protein
MAQSFVSLPVVSLPRLTKIDDLTKWSGDLVNTLQRTFLDLTEVLQGYGAPAANTGAIGDYYIDSSTNTMYGPKVAGSSPWPVAMVSGSGPVGPAGPPGPAGPQGPAGDPGVGAFRYVQATAATQWAIAHNLTFHPNVTAVDSTGREMIPGSIQYPDAANVLLTFSAAVGGEAYLS